MKDVAAAGASGASGPPGSAPGASAVSAPSTLFSDSSVPTCETTIAVARVVGRLAGQDVSFEMTDSSLITPGAFEYLQVRDREIERPIHFEFAPRNMKPGQANRLVGNTLLLPESQPGGGRWYCITSGEFGPLPEAEQPPGDNDAAFKFRIDGAYAEADCSGGEVDVDLRGCIYRTEGTIPSGYVDPDSPGAAPECTPLSRRLSGDVFTQAQVRCQDAALPGMPNPTHFGRNDSFALLQPLEPGRTYAMNLWPSLVEASDPVVGEIWGQSEACGAVQELLWVGELGPQRRFCIEFIPAMAHTHLLRVTRALNLNFNAQLGDEIRFCSDGSCAGMADGRGAVPGETLQTVAGTYRYEAYASLDFRYLWRVGSDGALLTVDSGGGSFDADPLQGAAFHMGQNEAFGDRWYCASGGRAQQGPRGGSYYVDVEGVSRMPACSDLAGSGTLTATWNHTDNLIDVTSTLPELAGADLYVKGECRSAYCSAMIRSDAGTWHLDATTEGDLGWATPTTAVERPIRDATWLSNPNGGPISLACGMRGTVQRDPSTSTTTIRLTGLGPLRSCTGEPVMPSSHRFVLAD